MGNSGRLEKDKGGEVFGQGGSGVSYEDAADEDWLAPRERT